MESAGRSAYLQLEEVKREIDELLWKQLPLDTDQEKRNLVRCVCVCKCAYISADINVFVYVCMCMYVCMYVQILSMYFCMCMCVCKCHMYVCMGADDVCSVHTAWSI